MLAPKPAGSPTLSDGPGAAAEVASLAGQMWGADEAADGHSVGSGKVYGKGTIEEILGAAGVRPDVTWDAPRNASEDVHYPLPKGFSDEDLGYLHRHLPNEEIYFVSTQKPHAFDLDVNFRVEDKVPELWHPDTGKVEAATFSTKNGITTVPLHMDPVGSVFVVFCAKAEAPRATQLPAKTVAEVHGPWRVTFPPNWGAPTEATFSTLESWTANNDAGIKYFSGTATCAKDIDVDQGWLAGHPLLLALGAVKDFAEVTVNGKPVGDVLWKPPFQVDIAPALHAGSNHLEIKITNLWPNRMIADLQPGVTKTYTFTDFHAFKSTSPLLESGLLGPVRMLQ